MYAQNNDPNPPCCASCKFFRPMDEDELSEHEPAGGVSDDMGRCVRYPPVFFYSKLLNAEFPVLTAGQYCGEYASNTDV